MDILTGRLGPREIALAVALGIILGLVPKANLLAVLLTVLIYLSHAHFGIAILVILLVSFVSPWIHPIADEIGRILLVSPIGQQIGGTLFQIPVVPWTMLDNTVVLGSFVMGVALFIPVYIVVWTPLKLVWPKPVEPTKPKPENPSHGKERYSQDEYDYSRRRT